MINLFEAIKADSGIAEGVACFALPESQSWLYGLTGSQKSVFLATAYQASPRPTVILVGSHENSEQYRSDLASLLPNTDVLELPAIDIVTFSADSKSIELAARRMDVLGRMLRGDHIIVIATAEAAIHKCLTPQDFKGSRITLTAGRAANRDRLLSTLINIGYERVDQVESRAQFSVRGGIIDIFPVNRDRPVRVELFEDEIDSLREFELVTQRSVDSIDLVDIVPLTEPEHSTEAALFLSYLPVNGATVLFDEPTRIREQISKLGKENPDIKRRTYSWNDLSAAAKPYNIMFLSLMLQKTPNTSLSNIISVTAKGIASFHRQMDLFVTEIKNWQERNYAIVVYLSTDEKAKAVKSGLLAEGVSRVLDGAQLVVSSGSILITTGLLETGFEFPHARLVVITERDIFGRQKKRPRPRAAKGQQITYFRDINIGDYVVHINHGIGKYVGVETLNVGGIHRDYLHIRYAGDDKLYVPTDQVSQLQKYIGAEGIVPRLHKMGGADWLKSKSKAQKAVADMAKELLELYAQRQVAAGYAFGPDTAWQQEFEDAFPFEETPDQLAAIAEIKADMEKPKAMDRLLCGDVGFGKTEVAIRAAFKAVMDGKQVAVLVPTTVLAQQHYRTFSSRFAGFGPHVDMVSRFKTPKEQKETLRKVATGQVDVLIGTHRILNSDVVFKDLGLLIVDEEQRFGVSQKEKIKRWRSNIDVLTLSATPIPRTLHMSLVGARDMSIIETPPEDRFPVQTYVTEYHDEIIRDAIKRELKRAGQVYFVYNRVQTIDKMYRHLAEMLPDAKIKVAHGQMPEELLEQAMLDFYEGHDDILLCTSIIENGLDVSNANTIIIYDADRFGLSQLYQMRGRVGRSHRMALAYFTYRRDKVLTEVAEKRLQAIKEFAELGAGFKIAMRDLEIRGAGNLLGSEQHGHIVSVGFEMYCRLLEEAVQELKTGQPVEIPPEPLLEFNVEAYLSGDYISDAMHKIEIYQRIAAIRSEEHIHDLLDELLDRFGDPPLPVQNLLSVARIKNLARQLGVRAIIQQPQRVEVSFNERPNVSIEKIFELKTRHPGKIAIIPGPPDSIHIKYGNDKLLLSSIENIFKAMIGA